MKNRYFSIFSFMFSFCFSPFLSVISQTSKEIKIDAQIVKYANNDCKGSLEIFTIEGITPFKYSIDGGKTFHDNKIFENLCEGKYFIQVKDAVGSYGITLLNLTLNQNPDIFNEAENEAIRQNTINDLLQIREAEINNWEKRRDIEYRLSRLNVKFPPIIVSEILKEDNVYLTFKTIVPERINISILYDHYNRLITLYKDYIIDISFDANKFTTTIIYKSNFPDSKLNDFFNQNGFSNYK